MVNDLKRIANALEHLAWATIDHGANSCSICKAKKKPTKKMPQSVVKSETQLKRMEEYLRQRQLLAGPEEPVADMFRYRELPKE